MRIELARYKNKKLYADTKVSLNSHFVIFGGTGAGKSVEGEKLITEIVEKGGTVLAFDLHQTLSDDEIFWKYKARFDLFRNEIKVYDDGLSCNLFDSIIYTNGKSEQQIDTICAMAEAVGRTLKLGCRQQSTLRTALSSMVDKKMYENEGFSALDKELSLMDTPVAEAVREKVYQLSAHNIFRPGDLFIRENEINIIRLSQFDLGTQETIAEMVLAYIWRLAMTNYFKEKQIFIYVDECPNLPSGKKSILSQMLSEGRKFGVNLILITQQLLPASTSTFFQRLTQCGTMLFFRPDANQVRMIAKIIDMEAEKEWIKVLKTLKRGEFVAMGALFLEKHRIEYPLKVSAFEKLNI